MIQGQFFMNVMKDDPTRDFQWIEDRLRMLDCPHLFLLAVPLRYLPPKTRSADPFKRFEPLYWLWNSVNGPVERAETMREYGIPDDATNREHLRRTGFLVIE